MEAAKMSLPSNSALERNRSFLSRRAPGRVKQGAACKTELSTVRPSTAAEATLAKRETVRALQEKYTVSENDTYDALYLKVRKLFLESL